MTDIFKLYEQMQDNNIMLSFKGEVSFDLVKSVLDIIEGRLERIEGNPKIKKKVFNVLVECLQNLSHHIEEHEEEIKVREDGRTALLMIWQEPSAYHVATGNYIIKDNVDRLKEWLDTINGRNREDLRKLYKDVLNNDQFTEKGGGGLGFIDIARKSGQKLHYSFKPIDNKFSFFSFQINIPKE
jgi:hypothetical protein